MIINLAKIDFGGGTSGGGGGSCNLMPWPPYFEASNETTEHRPSEFGQYDGFSAVGVVGYNVDTQYTDLEKILNGYSQDELIGRVYTTGPDAFMSDRIYVFDTFNKVHEYGANGWETKSSYTYNEDSKSGVFLGYSFTMNDDLSTMNCSLGSWFNWEATYNPNAMEAFSNPVISYTKWMTADRRYVVEFTDEAGMTINGETVDYGYMFRNDTRQGYYIPNGETVAYQLQYNDTSMIISTIDMGLTEFIPYTEPTPVDDPFAGKTFRCSEDWYYVIKFNNDNTLDILGAWELEGGDEYNIPYTWPVHDDYWNSDNVVIDTPTFGREYITPFDDEGRNPADNYTSIRFKDRWFIPS